MKNVDRRSCALHAVLFGRIVTAPAASSAAIAMDAAHGRDMVRDRPVLHLEPTARSSLR